MDDSDEEYMARADEFTRKLFADPKYLEEIRKAEVPEKKRRAHSTKTGERGAPSTSELAPVKAPENGNEQQKPVLPINSSPSEETEKQSQDRPAEKRAAPIVPFRIRIPLEPYSSTQSSSSENVQKIVIPLKSPQKVPEKSSDDVAQKTTVVHLIKPTRLPIAQKDSLVTVVPMKPAQNQAPLNNPSRRTGSDNQKLPRVSEDQKCAKMTTVAPPIALNQAHSRQKTTIALPTPETSSTAQNHAPLNSPSRQSGTENRVASTCLLNLPKAPIDNQKLPRESVDHSKIEKCGVSSETCSIVLNQAQEVPEKPIRQPTSDDVAQKTTKVLPIKPIRLQITELYYDLPSNVMKPAQNQAPLNSPFRQRGSDNQKLPRVSELEKCGKMITVVPPVSSESCSNAPVPLNSPSRQSDFDENIQSTSTPKDKQEASMELQKTFTKNQEVPQDRPTVAPPVKLPVAALVLPPKAKRPSEPTPRQTAVDNHVKSINTPNVLVDHQKNATAQQSSSRSIVPAVIQNSQREPAEIPQNRPVVQPEIVIPRIPKSSVNVPPPETRKKHPLDRLEASGKKQPAPQPAPRAPCVQKPLLRSMRNPERQEQPAPPPPPPRNPRIHHRPSDIIPVRVRQITTHGSQPVRASQPNRPPVVASSRSSETALGRHVPSRTNMMAVESRVMPILGTSSPVDDQTTWVEEDVPSPVSPPITDNSPFDPNESILAASSSLVDPSIIEPLDPELHEYPPMFAALTREFAERDRRDQENQRNQQHQEPRRTVSVLNLNGEVVHLNLNARPDNNTPDLSPYMMANYRGSFDESVYRAPDIGEPRRELRTRLLPPIAKGKLSTNPVVRVTAAVVDPVGMGSVQRQTNAHHHDFFEPAPLDIQPVRSSTPQSVESVESPSDESSYLSNLIPEDLMDKSEKELLDITNQFYYSGPYQKFRRNYPFLAEGIVQKDCETGELKVYSQRVGKIMIEDTRKKREDDYVYFIVVSPGVYRGFSFYKHPNCLISAKFPKTDQIVLRGYAILAHPVGPREESMKDNQWVCWNDSLGVMSINKGSALIPFKKYPVWDKQLDIISFKAGFQNRKFVVEQVVVLTNLKEKQEHFPQEAFLVTDARWSGDGDVDLEFYSDTVKAPIYIRKMLVGTVDYTENQAFELVVVPTFPGMTNPQFRGLLIISMPCMFWSKDKEWIRKRLVERAQAYRC
ncbi:hypothetical protein CAEBREN_25923 [Caenorhabditis brenneri]|uniref:Uncharacterized protein n=1 Tax=Caenorhabditis brenneri TaxID=135651 RepID=G0MFE0_CAEBE|nr:hypothetical protein CAEBREN_25923 [Caenorhabditis brenneri]